ncbi:MAG TPA: hypothetical protein VGM15_03280 [Burkholderiaceae bacterium]|jgi:hypothetical protein
MPDILPTDPRRAPALNTTSDMPSFEEPAPKPPEPPPEPAGLEAPLTPPAGEETPPEEPGEPPGAPPEPPAPGEPPKPKQKPWYQRKFDEQAAKIAEERKAREAAEARAARLEAEQAERIRERAKAASEAEQTDLKPDRTKYDDPDQYTEDMAGWSARRAIREAEAAAEERGAKARAAEQEAATQRAIDKLHADHRARVEAAQKKYGAAYDKLTGREDIRMHLPVYFQIESSPMSAELLYHIGQHPEVAARLNEVAEQNLHALGREIGRIEARLEDQAARAQVSKTDEPLEPIGARADTGPKDPNEESMEEFAARRMPQLQKERKPFITGRTRAR